MIEVTKRHRYADTRCRLFDLRRGTSPSAWWWAFGLGCEAPVSRRWHD